MKLAFTDRPSCISLLPNSFSAGGSSSNSRFMHFSMLLGLLGSRYFSMEGVGENLGSCSWDFEFTSHRFTRFFTIFPYCDVSWLEGPIYVHTLLLRGVRVSVVSRASKWKGSFTDFRDTKASSAVYKGEMLGATLRCGLKIGQGGLEEGRKGRGESGRRGWLAGVSCFLTTLEAIIIFRFWEKSWMYLRNPIKLRISRAPSKNCRKVGESWATSASACLTSPKILASASAVSKCRPSILLFRWESGCSHARTRPSAFTATILGLTSQAPKRLQRRSKAMRDSRKAQRNWLMGRGRKQERGRTGSVSTQMAAFCRSEFWLRKATSYCLWLWEKVI